MTHRRFTDEFKEEAVKQDHEEALRKENLRLKNELKRVEEERDILKKAAAYFAKTSG
jgi:transposase